MKNYRLPAVICALSVLLTACKAQPMEDSAEVPATTEATTEAATDTAQTEDAADNGAGQTDHTTDAPTTTTTTFGTDNCVTYPSSIEVAVPEEPDSDADAPGFVSYTIGNEYASFTFDAPDDLYFEDQEPIPEYRMLYGSMGYYTGWDYSVGAILMDFGYTLGQPQELIDFLGFSERYYISSEFVSETTESGIAYDLIIMDLYDDEAMQEYDSSGVIGCYPMECGVLFFGYEMDGREMTETAMKSVDTLMITEYDPDEQNIEYPTEFTSYTVGNDSFGFTFDAPVGISLREETAFNDDFTTQYECYSYNDGYTIGVMVVDFDYTLGRPQELLDYMRFDEQFGVRTEFRSAVADDGTPYDLVIMDLYEDEDMSDYYSTGVLGFFPMEDGVLFFGYELEDQLWMHSAYRTVASLVIGGAPAPEMRDPDEVLPIIVCDNGCSFPVLPEYGEYDDGDEDSIWSGQTSDRMAMCAVYRDTEATYADIMGEMEQFRDALEDVDITVEDVTASNGTAYGFIEVIDDEYHSIFAIYEAEVGSYFISYMKLGRYDDVTRSLIIRSFEGFELP